MTLTEADAARLTYLAEQMLAILAKDQATPAPGVTAQVSRATASCDTWAAHPLYVSLRPLKKNQVVLALRELGFIKVRRERGYFWVRPPASQDRQACP
jgi:hypothetical protein